MVMRPGSYQSSCNAGEISPEARGNTGLKQYYSGTTLMENVEPVPQGGFKLMPRTRFRGRIRRNLTLAWSDVGLTTASFSTAQVLHQWDFGVVLDLSTLDVGGLSCSAGYGLRFLKFQVRDAYGDWQDLGGPVVPGTTPVWRRLARPPRVPLLGTSVRMVSIMDLPGSVTITLGGIAVYREGPDLPTAFTEMSFSVSRAESYMAVFSPGNVDFWRAGIFAGGSYHPFNAAQVGELQGQQRDETMLLFHQDVKPQRILRNAADWDWSWGDAPFTHIPEVDYGGVYNDIAEKWQVYIKWASGTSAADNSFIISVDGIETSAIKVDAALDWTATAALLKTALEDLPNVEPGITVAVIPSPPTNTAGLSIEFTGALNAGNLYSLGGRSVSNASEIGVTTSRLLRGKRGGEAVMSAGRGWPACGTWYNDRGLLGGFKAKGGAWAASRSGEYYDLNIELESAAGAVLFNLDTDGSESIRHFGRAANLVLFTDRAEYYLADRAIDRTKPPNVVRSSAIGASIRVPIVEQEGALLFVSREETIVYAAEFDYQTQTYVPRPLSLLASHLIEGVRGAAIMASYAATDAQRYFLPRDDGLMIVSLMIRNQDITAFVRWTTGGLVRSVGVDGANMTYLVVERTVDGVPDLFVETLEDGLLLDATVDVHMTIAGKVVGLLDVHEGEEVWSIVNGYIDGPYTVVGGQITLQDAVQVGDVVSVGRWQKPHVESLPMVRNVSERAVLKRPARIHTLQLSLLDTQSIAVGANGGRPKDVPLYRAGDAVDTPFAGYSGDRAVTGLNGFSIEGKWVITQTRPGALQVRDITVQARL